MISEDLKQESPGYKAFGQESPKWDLRECTSRGTQLWILDHLTGMTSRMLLTLRVIDNKARGQTTITMTHEEIAKFWMASKSPCAILVRRGIPGKGVSPVFCNRAQ